MQFKLMQTVRHRKTRRLGRFQHLAPGQHYPAAIVCWQREDGTYTPGRTVKLDDLLPVVDMRKKRQRIERARGK